jgi:hypothetical protein
MRIAFAVAVLIGSSLSAAADSGPVFAVPGKAGVPVVINGRDASWAVVEGDWGLASRIHVQPTVIGGWDRYPVKEVGHYYPSSGQLPGYGRVEIETPPRPQAPPQSYRQSWGAESAPVQMTPPAEPPPVVLAPDFGAPPRGVPPRR